jgi:membrane dipeptidase
MRDFSSLHSESLVIDATCPLASFENWYESWIKGGATAIAATVCYGNLDTLTGFKRTADWLSKIRNDPKLMLIETADQILEAKAKKKMGVILAFQTTTPFSTDPTLVKAFQKLGIRIALIAYNQRNFVGDGCTEPGNIGLSTFGKKLIKELNREGILIDVAHTGYKTAMESIEYSEKPVVFTHSNPRVVYDNPRNIPDDLIKAIAQKNGVIGMNGYPAFLSESNRPSMDLFLKHMQYIIDLVGIDYVGLGIDYYEYQAGVASDADAKKMYDWLIASGTWSRNAYPPPPWYYPEGIELPEKLPNLTASLIKKGFSDQDIKKILGLNFHRVFKTVWGA